jgi:hypothetical protein
VVSFGRYTAILVVLTGFFLTDSAHAQRGLGRYEPQRPTLSPYLNFGRADRAATDVYNAFVRPEIQLQRTVEMQGALITRLYSPQQTVAPSPHGRVDQRVPATGTGSVFFNLSHYYPLQPRLGLDPRTSRRASAR